MNNLWNKVFRLNFSMIKTVQELNVALNKGPALVDFYATWCGPCRVLSPILDRVVESSKQSIPNLQLIKIDVDHAAELATHYNISSLPTVIYFQNGKQVGSFMGARDEKFITNFIANPQ